MSEVVGLCDACRAGDQEAVERLLRGLPAAAGLVERIGGHRAMVRFLMERRHLVGLMGRPSVESVVEWLHELLREAEPLHLFDPSRALAEAEAGGHAEMVRRLKRHRQFFQPPDPTRWTRRIPSPLEVAFLEACRAGDVALVERSLSEDAELAGTRDVEGRDPLEVVAAQGGEETLAVAKRLLAAGLPRHAGPVARAAARGDEPLLALLLGAGWPTVDGRERHALMEAAVAEGAGRLDTATFGAVATTLVGAGADPNRADRWGDRPWGQATAEGRERLQALGAEPVARGPGRYDPETGLSRTLAALVAGASPDPEVALDLDEAAAAGDLAQVDRLLDEVWDRRPGLRRAPGPLRPLHFAAYFGRVDVIHRLIARGYSPAEEDGQTAGRWVGPADLRGRNPIEVAVARGQEGAFKVLMNSVDFFQGRRARRK